MGLTLRLAALPNFLIVAGTSTLRYRTTSLSYLGMNIPRWIFSEVRVPNIEPTATALPVEAHVAITSLRLGFKACLEKAHSKWLVHRRLAPYQFFGCYPFLWVDRILIVQPSTQPRSFVSKY